LDAEGFNEFSITMEQVASYRDNYQALKGAGISEAALDRMARVFIESWNASKKAWNGTGIPQCVDRAFSFLGA